MHLDIPLEIKTINDLKEDLMKVHVYYLEAPSNADASHRNITSNGFSEPTRSQNGTSNGNDQPVNSDISMDISDVPEATGDTISEVTGNLLTNINSCKEKLKNIPKEKESRQSLTPKLEEPQEEMSSREENARIAKEAYHFEENPIFIPENLKHRVESNTG